MSHKSVYLCDKRHEVLPQLRREDGGQKMKVEWTGKIKIEMDMKGDVDEISKLVGTWSDVFENLIADDFEGRQCGTVIVTAVEYRIEECIGKGHSESLWNRC